MPRTREHHELTTVRGSTGLGYEAKTIADCERSIQRLTDLIHSRGNATPAQVDVWRADRDIILDRLSYLIVVSETPRSDR